MAKFKVGERPATITKNVTWKALDGSNASLGVTLNLYSRSEYARIAQEAGFGDKLEDGASVSDIISAVDDRLVQVLLKAIKSWDLEDDVSEKNLRRLADEYPAGAQAIWDAFRVACAEGKLGN